MNTEGYWECQLYGSLQSLPATKHYLIICKQNISSILGLWMAPTKWFNGEVGTVSEVGTVAPCHSDGKDHGICDLGASDSLIPQVCNLNHI